jgi:hypothetical protein
MKTLSWYILVLLPVLMLVGGCASRRPEGARLNSAEAIQLAREAARHAGINLDHYGGPAASFSKDQTWLVMFEGRAFMRSPGDSFVVSVDDRTGVTQVIRGK